MKEKNWYYSTNHDNSARFILGTKGKNPLIAIGVNPSTASPNNLDRTLQSVERIATYNGFDSWIMLNLYPQRATNPNEISKSLNKELHIKNLDAVRDIFSKTNNPIIWPCWGTLINKRDYLKKCFFDIYDITNDFECMWISFGNNTKDGHPHHPLYLANDSTQHRFEVESYREGFKALIISLIEVFILIC